MVDELDGITLTKDNIEYPTHFVHTAKGLRHVKEVFPEEIQKEIKRGIEHLRKNNEDGCGSWYTSYGNLFIVIYRYPGDEEYFVVVTQDFYETYIPFEEVDYE